MNSLTLAQKEHMLKMIEQADCVIMIVGVNTDETNANEETLIGVATVVTGDSHMVSRSVAAAMRKHPDLAKAIQTALKVSIIPVTNPDKNAN